MTVPAPGAPESTPANKCPECGKQLQKVRYSSDSMLNRDQFDSIRAGDYYCMEHTNGRGNQPYAYYWESELPAEPASSLVATTEPAKKWATFDEWWEQDGRFYDPDWSDVPWYDKRKSLAEYAWHRSKGETK